MPDVELGGGQRREGGELSSSAPSWDFEDGKDGESGSREGSGGGGCDGAAAGSAAGPVLSVVISQPGDAAALMVEAPKSTGGLAGEKGESLVEIGGAKKGVPRSESYHEQCRVCQQQADEPLMDLGCRCRGELAKVHLSCIEIWFRTRGSNKCEICQQVAVNIPSPELQPNTNYWIWRVDPAFGNSNRRRAERERGCFNPLWIAFCILICGLLLDVLISVSFGVSALPVNIIIGILIVLGLGTAIRLALECCHEWNMQRIARRAAETSVNPHYHPDV